MSEDKTKTLGGDSKLFEQILTKLEVLDARLQRVEIKVEERGFDTKPIWEKALAAIMEVNQQIATLNRKIDVFNSDMLNVRATQLENEARLRRLETEREGSVTIIQ
jgi:hypothetical protein